MEAGGDWEGVPGTLRVLETFYFWVWTLVT